MTIKMIYTGRISKANSSWYGLRSIGIDSNALSVKTKIHMYKTYLRPLLTYGLECLTLTKTQIDDLKLAESNLVKKVIGISKYCHHSDLMPALGLDNIETVIKDLTLGFNKRLCDNPFTKELLDHRYHEINGININKIYIITIKKNN